MIVYDYFGKEQKLYYEKLDNGLEIFLLPNPNIKAYHVDIVSKYGSDIKRFIPINEDKYLTLPQGVAHFLEHKLFDMKDSNPFTFFANFGTYVNAGTNYISTRYYIDGKKCYFKNLEYLLNMVFTPFFEDESINKEKKVIAEEIKMYEDEPSWILDYETKKCLYQAFYQDKIAGTVDSIQKINSDILNKTYNTFYQPSNMFMVITGNIPIKKTIDLIKNNQALKKRESNQKIIYQELKENKMVTKEYACLPERIILPKLNYSFKFDLKDFDIPNRMQLVYYLNFIFSSLFGAASSFNEKIIEDKIATDFYLDHSVRDDIYTLSFDAESAYADLFKETIDQKLQHIKISEDDFNRLKKTFTSITIRSIDNIAALASSIVISILKKDDCFEQLKILESLKYEDLDKVVKKCDFSNHSFVIMLPKE